MLWLKPYIDRIQSLLDDGTPQSLTYAALEARLAIERACYERLRVAHDYISHADLKKWQPAKVVTILIAEVDTHIASDFTLSISKTPAKPKAGDLTAKDFAEYEFVEVGRQIGFDPKKLGHLWNALSNHLHVKLPTSKKDKLASYGEPKTVGRKVEEALVELRRLSTGTLVSTGMGREVHFDCECGTKNKRRADLLEAGKVLSCMNPECSEKWVVEFEGEEIFFRRKSVTVKCFACGHPNKIGEQDVLSMPRSHVLEFPCEACEAKSRVMWRLCFAKPPAWAPDSTDAQGAFPSRQ